jgi:N-acetylmuramoyl-L-alanine amidase
VNLPNRALQRRSFSWPLLVLGGVVGFTLLLSPVRSLRSENFVFYLPTGHKVMPLTLIENVRYLPVLPVLSLVGTVSNMQQRRNSLKLQLDALELEFRAGDKRVRVNKAQLKLTNPVRLIGAEWVVPLEFLYFVLPKLTRQALEYREGDRRMFVGELRPATFSVRLDPISNGTRLSLQFTGKLTIQTAARNGKWIIYLVDQLVQPMESTYRFQSPYVSELQFDDQDGVPKLILTPAAAGLDFYPKLGDEGRVLMADVVNPATAVAQQPEGTVPKAVTPAPGARPPGAPVAPGAAQPAPAPQPVLPAVVLDAGHGGKDLGARSRDGINEKDLTAQLVERVRQGLVSTGKFRVVLTRAGDADPTFDQRDVAANVALPVAFVTFHAGNMGGLSPCATVYTYPAVPEPPRGSDVSPMFRPWQAAQQKHLPQSERLKQEVGHQLEQVPGLARSNTSIAVVRQLRSVDAPAIAVEVGSLAPEVDGAALTNPDFQQHIADVLVQALTKLGPS